MIIPRQTKKSNDKSFCLSCKCSEWSFCCVRGNCNVKYFMTKKFLGFFPQCWQPSQIRAKEMRGTAWVYSLGHEHTDSYN